LAFALWWAYFGGDDERAERALAAVDRPRRAWAALYAYGHGHYLLVLGIVVLAAGVKKVFGHAFGPVALAQALALGGGVALFLLGDLVFRRVLRIGPPWYRLAGVFVSLATVPVGLVCGVLQQVVLTVALGGLLGAEVRAARS